MRAVGASLLLSIILSFLYLSAADAAEQEDVFCEKSPVSGVVEKIPSPFDKWAVVICTANGQALMPEMGKRGNLWLRHGTASPLAVNALPPGTPPYPKSEKFDPRYGIRFSKFAGSELTAQKRDMSMKMLQVALKSEVPSVIDGVFQLDALSVVNLTLYNLFFYTEKMEPKYLLACLDRCNRAVLLDVKTLDEAKELAIK